MSTNSGNHGGRGADNSSRYCSFCGRTEHQVEFLIPSPTGLYICDTCVSACRQLIDDTLEELRLSDPGEVLSFQSLPKPTQIKAILDEYVIGQDDAKIALSVAV